jgi:hypothetical protein
MGFGLRLPFKFLFSMLVSIGTHLSGVGADLEERIVRIMSTRDAFKLDFSGSSCSLCSD